VSNVEYYLKKFLEVSEKFTEECLKNGQRSAEKIINLQYYVKEYSKYLCSEAVKEIKNEKES